MQSILPILACIHCAYDVWTSWFDLEIHAIICLWL